MAARKPASSSAGIHRKATNSSAVLHRVEIRARDAFGKVEFVRVRHALTVHPESFIETDTPGNERVNYVQSVSTRDWMKIFGTIFIFGRLHEDLCRKSSLLIDWMKTCGASLHR